MDNAQASPLSFAAFAAANRARCESPEGFGHRLDSWSLSDWFTATMGELGEAANVAKKLNRVRDGIRGNTASEAELRAELQLEVADTLIYLDLLAQNEGFTLAEAVVAAWDAKSEQIGYPGRLGAGVERAEQEQRAAGLRRMTLDLDADDHDTIQGEIARRQAASRAIDPDGPTLVPEGESDLAGALLAECIRELDEYRAIHGRGARPCPRR